MSAVGSKPDVVELARAQLDFAAMNAAAPSAKDILFKAQTIVPIAPRIPWEKYAKGAGAAAVLCAALCVPWLPQQTSLGIAGAQFDVMLDPAEAQRLVNAAVRAFSAPGEEALVSADYAPQRDGTGLLLLRAARFGEDSASLQTRLGRVLAAADAPAAGLYSVADYEQRLQSSPLRVGLEKLKAGTPVRGEAYPSSGLADEVLAGAGLLEQELRLHLQQHGYLLTGFAFAQDSELLPLGCQFTVGAWPQPAAAGVKGYHQLASYQQAEVRGIVGAWLRRMNLSGLDGQVAAGPTDEVPVVCEVVDRQGRTDDVLTARLNAVLQQPTAEDMARLDYSLEQAVALAAGSVLPGIERRVDFERSGGENSQRYRVRVTMQGRAGAVPDYGAPDPVEDSTVREEW